MFCYIYTRQLNSMKDGVVVAPGRKRDTKHILRTSHTPDLPPSSTQRERNLAEPILRIACSMNHVIGDVSLLSVSSEVILFNLY